MVHDTFSPLLIVLSWAHSIQLFAHFKFKLAHLLGLSSLHQLFGGYQKNSKGKPCKKNCISKVLSKCFSLGSKFIKILAIVRRDHLVDLHRRKKKIVIHHVREQFILPKYEQPYYLLSKTQTLNVVYIKLYYQYIMHPPPTHRSLLLSLLRLRTPAKTLCITCGGDGVASAAFIDVRPFNDKWCDSKSH